MKKIGLITIVITTIFFSKGYSSTGEIKTVSGFRIPKKISHWYLTNTHAFNLDGTNIAFAFNNTLHDLLKGAIYIYPGKSKITKKEIKIDFRKEARAALLGKKKPKIILLDIGTKTIKRQKFPSAFMIMEYMAGETLFTSYLVIIYVEKWKIKYRITFKSDSFDIISKEIEKMLNGIKLP